MTITITDREMDSDVTSHKAEYGTRVAADGSHAWVVTWLPLRLLDRNQAITAMSLAEDVTPNPPDPSDRREWSLITFYAEELGLTAEDAIQRIRKTTPNPL